MLCMTRSVITRSGFWSERAHLRQIFCSWPAMWERAVPTSSPSVVLTNPLGRSFNSNAEDCPDPQGTLREQFANQPDTCNMSLLPGRL
jgi:hypothetical protein